LSPSEILPTENLQMLETQLRSLSHSDEALKIIQRFTNNLGKTRQRQMIFGEEGALLRQPIEYQEMLQRGAITENEDPFFLLQGDIVSTDAGYFLGERISGCKFAIATSTCDLVAHRRQYAVMLRLHPIRATEKNAAQLLGELLKFKSTSRMYLPALPDDPSEVIANAIIFDGIVQIRLDDLLLATRLASLSLVGWRIFGSLLRSILVRAGESEVEMRACL